MKGVKEALKDFSIGDLTDIASNSITLAISYLKEKQEKYKNEKEELYEMNKKIFDKYPGFSKTYENYIFMRRISGHDHIWRIPEDFEHWPFKTDEIKLKLKRGYLLITKELYEKEIQFFYNKYRREMSLLNKLKSVSNKSEENILANIHLEASYMKTKYLIKRMF